MKYIFVFIFSLSILGCNNLFSGSNQFEANFTPGLDQPNSETDDGSGDPGGPVISGLTNDLKARTSKTWTWSCNQTCTFRFLIDQSPTTTLTGNYTSATTATQSSGSGTYYIHVQAQNKQGLRSAVVHASALLDNDGPTLDGSISFASFDQNASQTSLMTWAPATTTGAAIDRYEISISTDEGNDVCDNADAIQDVLDWTKVPAAADFEGAGYRIIHADLDGNGLPIDINFVPMTNYCISIRAIDALDQSSGLIHSPVWKLPFKPSDAANLAIWLDASDATTLYQSTDCTTTLANIGNTVGCWRDKSGNNKHFSQNSASRRPIRTASQLDFDGADDFMTQSGLLYDENTVTSYFVVTEFDNQSNVSSSCCRPLVSFVTNSSALYPWIGSTRGDLTPPNSIFHGWVGSPLSPIAATPGDTFIMSAIHDGANQLWNVYTNGTQFVADYPIPANYTTTTALSIGGDTINAARRYHGTIREVLFYDTIFSPTTIREIEGYLACKWGMRNRLTPGHPYYNANGTSQMDCP